GSTDPIISARRRRPTGEDPRMNILLSDDSASLAAQLQKLWADTPGRLGTLSCAVSVAREAAAWSSEAGAALLDLQHEPSHQKELAATIADALGQALLNRGFLDQAKGLIEQGVEIRSAFLGPDHPATAASFNSSARLARNEG